MDSDIKYHHVEENDAIDNTFYVDKKVHDLQSDHQIEDTFGNVSVLF